MIPIHTLIMAAGQGTRLGETPKQFLSLGGKSILAWALLPFQKSSWLAERVVVLPKSSPNYPGENTCVGGNTRAASVLNGLIKLESFGASDNDFVLVHDAARPCLSLLDLQQLVLLCQSHPVGGLLAEPVRDTLKQVDMHHHIQKTIPRTHLWQASTPQMFRLGLLKRALLACQASDTMATDEAESLEHMGLNGQVVPLQHPNPKLTFAHDIPLIEALLMGQKDMRVGIGFDIHRFKLGQGTFKLAGVDIPHTHTVEAHSDGDVALHALCDALLGAAVLGDIGLYFPDSNPQHKNQDSAYFVTEILKKLHKIGYTVHHIDMNLVLEKPKLRPFIDDMRKQISLLCDISITAVSIKAKTMEGLGPLGQGLGLSAHVVVMIQRNLL